MNKNYLTPLLAVALSTSALGDGTRLPSQDDFVVARGYADVATADRGSAVYYNPAGLAQIDSVEIEAGTYVLTPQSTYTPPGGGGTISSSKQTFVLPYAFLAIPLAPMGGRQLALGIGAYSPFGLSSNWPQNTGFRTLATSNEVEYYTGAISLAVPVAPGLMLGGNLEYNHQHVDLNRGLGFFPNDRFHFAGDGRAMSYDLGLLWQPTAQHSFGVNFHSKANFRIRGTANLDPFGISYSGYADWVYPEDLSIGYSYRPRPDWNIEADWDWTNWKRLRTVVLYSPVAAPTPLPFNWQSSSYYNFGATHQWGAGWDTSAGVSVSTNSVPTASFNPAIVDATKVLYNLGPGYSFGHWRLQSVVQWSPKATRDITGTPPSPAGQTADGTYTIELWALGFGADYRW
jgi:long-chain fatty acid transport protein